MRCPEDISYPLILNLTHGQGKINATKKYDGLLLGDVLRTSPNSSPVDVCQPKSLDLRLAQDEAVDGRALGLGRELDNLVAVLLDGAGNVVQGLARIEADLGRLPA